MYALNPAHQQVSRRPGDQKHSNSQTTDGLLVHTARQRLAKENKNTPYRQTPYARIHAMQ
jgi:hypothetical protein